MRWVLCVIDEPENHLHPALQQSLFTTLIKAFPNVQFIIATHSPFLITATPNSSIYVLERENGGVVSSSPDLDRAGTANETLRNVFGLESTLPLWAERKFNEITARFVDKDPSDENIKLFETALRDAGLENYAPDSRIDADDQA